MIPMTKTPRIPRILRKDVMPKQRERRLRAMYNMSKGYAGQIKRRNGLEQRCREMKIPQRNQQPEKTRKDDNANNFIVSLLLCININLKKKSHLTGIMCV